MLLSSLVIEFPFNLNALIILHFFFWILHHILSNLFVTTPSNKSKKYRNQYHCIIYKKPLRRNSLSHQNQTQKNFSETQNPKVHNEKNLIFSSLYISVLYIFCITTNIWCEKIRNLNEWTSGRPVIFTFFRLIKLYWRLFIGFRGFWWWSFDNFVGILKDKG